MRGADFSRACLAAADLEGADLHGARLDDAVLAQAHLPEDAKKYTVGWPRKKVGSACT
ncbi:hypothetical protein GEV43_29590 [Actinomadura sp. J1-007]|uniref:pentapeptide repeat-containing protein n=1 Tax=Actinomadura sp. J1-007 TaxID=2661913 RepID=UPI0013263E3D|nr:hypothetical protein [Actinomadura sp. J1-007]